MRIRNNSKLTWLAYDCGESVVDILPETEFEVSEVVGQVLLRNLGCEKWLVKIEATPKDVIPAKELEKKPRFCEFCTSKGIKHKKDCTRP